MKESIEQLVALELESAEAKFPKHNSAHESYAILKEEFEELKEVYESFYVIFEHHLWNSIKCDDTKAMEAQILTMKEYSMRILEESVQLSAMCDRFKKDVLS